MLLLRSKHRVLFPYSSIYNTSALLGISKARRSTLVTNETRDERGVAVVRGPLLLGCLGCLFALSRMVPSILTVVIVISSTEVWRGNTDCLRTSTRFVFLWKVFFSGGLSLVFFAF